MSWGREGVKNSQNVWLMRFLHCLHFSLGCLHQAFGAVALPKDKTGVGERVDYVLL